MISKQQVKFVKSLKLKKYRKKAESFLVEGAKNVIELLNSDYVIQYLYLTDKFLQEYPDVRGSFSLYEICTEKELVELGTFQSNEYALAVAGMKPHKTNLSDNNLIIALDDVSDPGNLGTIIRIADWYGIEDIVASKDTADFYNPKVINASMGSFTRVDVHYMDLDQFLNQNQTHAVYGAYLEGENVHESKLVSPAILVMGNESKGIGEQLKSHVNHKITIPRYGKAESLNVAISTAIICDNFRRKDPKK